METKDSEIVIIGAGLTGLSLAHFLKKSGRSPLILEQSDKPGGVINTVSENGFIFETGPNTGVLSSFELVTIFEDLKDKCSISIANKGAEKRYVMKNGKWQALPSGLFSAVSTPLFTLKDKFRILGEPFRKPGSDPDESVADMVVRRLGRSYLDYAVDPFISGIYAGDPSRLVTRYALPKLYALEHNYGSFIKGTIKKSREPKSEDDKKVTKKVFSADGGLGNLIKALADDTGSSNIVCGAKNIRIETDGNGFIVNYLTHDNQTVSIKTNKVVSTIGGYNLPELLPFLPSELLSPMLGLEYAGVVQAAVGFKKWDGFPLDAFGALVPTKEKRNILGILFPSAIFKGRAPEGGALLSVFLGGIKNSGLIKMTDDQIIGIVLGEIESTLNNSNKPDLLKIYRYTHAIPQYEKSSGERLDAINTIEKKFPGLILAGNIRDGIGMADRVKQAKKIADSLIDSRL